MKESKKVEEFERYKKIYFICAPVLSLALMIFTTIGIVTINNSQRPTWDTHTNQMMDFLVLLNIICFIVIIGINIFLAMRLQKRGKFMFYANFVGFFVGTFGSILTPIPAICLLFLMFNKEVKSYYFQDKK